MGGVNGFNDSYGFNKKKQSVIGLDANGLEHIVDSWNATSFPNRPPPAVESIDVELYGGQNASFSGLCRKAVIKWKCYSLDQLKYLTPYFLSSKVTCCIEWGWDNYNPTSLIDYTDVNKMRSLFASPKEMMRKIYESNGNYDGIIGYVIDFSFSLDPLGAWECSTTVVNVAWLFEGTDYSNQTLKKKNGAVTEQIEGFKEFNEVNGWNNKSRPDPNFPVLKGRMFKFDGKQGSSGTTQWVRFDYFIEVLNYFFEKLYDTIDTKTGQKVSWNKINIDNTLICAHPGIKSIDPAILIPNQFAPKYTLKSDKVKGSGQLSNKTIDNSNYFQKFGVLKSKLEISNFSDEYDDLYNLIQKKVDGGVPKSSFPIFSSADIADDSYKGNVGYVGYLRDLYISTDFINSEVGQNRTAKTLLDSIIKKISSAMCGMVELKVVPYPVDSTQVTIMDTKFTPVYNKENIKKLETIILASINSGSFLTNASMNVKMIQEMANQVLFTAGSDELQGKTVQQTDVSSFGRFVSNDRMGTPNQLKSSQTSINDPANIDKNKIVRSSKDTGFNICTVDNIGYYLNEPDSILMEKIITDDPSPSAVYLNSAIMPGTTFEMEMLGIGGFTYLGQFTLDHVPTQYSYRSSVWQISNIKQSISQGSWKTTITSQIRPISTL